MKRITAIILLVALFAIGANAIQISDINVGGENQDRLKDQSVTFSVKNNNSVQLTNVRFSFSGGAENSKYAMQVFGSNTLAASVSESYTLNFTFPLDHPGVDPVSLKELAIKIGIITATGNIGAATDSDSANINMQAVNQLRIKKARIECDTKSKSVDDGDRIKNLKPGEDCTLEIEVENEFDDSDRNNLKTGDIEFSNIDIRVDSSDNDIDVDEDDDIDDLDAEDEDSVTIDIEIDDEADDGTVTLDIRVSGKDENGALHGEAMDIRLEVERLSHDIQIRRIELSPSVVSNCEASDSRLSVNVLNQGKRDEDEVTVEVSITDLSFNEKIENLELDKDDSNSISFSIPIQKSASSGVVRVDVKTYFDSIALSNSGSVELIINECELNNEPEETPKPIDNTQQQTSNVVTQAPPVVPQGGQ